MKKTQPPSPNEIIYSIFEFTGLWNLVDRQADTVKQQVRQAKSDGRALSMEAFEGHLRIAMKDSFSEADVEATIAGVKRFVELYRDSLVHLSRQMKGVVPQPIPFLLDLLIPAIFLAALHARAVRYLLGSAGDNKDLEPFWWRPDLDEKGKTILSPVNKVAREWRQALAEPVSHKINPETLESWCDNPDQVPQAANIRDEFRASPYWLFRMFLARGSTRLFQKIRDVYGKDRIVTFQLASGEMSVLLNGKYWPDLRTRLSYLLDKPVKEKIVGCADVFRSFLKDTLGPNLNQFVLDRMLEAHKGVPSTGLAVEAINVQARAFMSAGQWSKALACYRRVIEGRKGVYWATMASLCEDGICLACWLHVNKKKLMARVEGSPLVTAKHFRTFARTLGVCVKLERPSEDAYQENAAVEFVQKFDGLHPLIKAEAKRIYSGSSYFTHICTGDGGAEWTPDFKKPNRVVRLEGAPSISQLICAVLLRETAFVCGLIDAGADLNFLDAHGQSVFHFVMCNAHWADKYSVATRLLSVTGDRAMKVDILDSCSAKKKKNALSLAIIHRQPDLVERLLSRGCNPNIDVWPVQIPLLRLAVQCVSDHPKTCVPADAGSTNDALNVLELMLQHKACVSKMTANGMNVLHLAAELQLPSAISVLLKYGAKASVNDKCAGGWTPLSYAVINNDTASAKVLVDAGAICDIVLDCRKSLPEMALSDAMRRLLADGIMHGQSRSVIF